MDRVANKLKIKFQLRELNKYEYSSLIIFLFISSTSSSSISSSSRRIFIDCSARSVLSNWWIPSRQETSYKAKPHWGLTVANCYHPTTRL